MNMSSITISELNTSHQNKEPLAIIKTAFEVFPDAILAFSGSEDVIVIDMAHKLGIKPTVFVLDTGRLHPETYQYIEKIRKHYNLNLLVTFPKSADVEEFVKNKGLFSFRQDGHAECCKIRKVDPLRRILQNRPAWITGMRQDQSVTRDQVAIFAADPVFSTANNLLHKINPLSHWSSKDVWEYITEFDVPFNPLHSKGYISIGCAACTRSILPTQHERTGRWWWEDSEKKECGLHSNSKKT